jgi:hypothetical protein
MKLSPAILTILSALATIAAAQEPTHTWQVETAQRPAPYALEIIRGETITLAPQYVSNGVAASLQGATNATFRYRSADMPDGTYYAISGTTTGGAATFAWGSTNCAGPTNYAYTIAIVGSGVNLRSYGTIKLIGSVGGTSAALPTNATFDTSAYAYLGVFPSSVIPTTESTLPTGAIVATNQGVAGQSFFFSSGTPTGVSTGYFATASGSGDMLISVYDAGGAKQVAFTNNPKIALAVTSGVFVAGTGVTNVGGVLQIGSNGIVGATGPQGPAGATGPQGPAGTNGATGATGPQGPAGTNGATGATGPQGPAGTNGATGATGPQGPAGTNGATGATGPQGPAGTNGATGATGPQGPSGTNGANAYISISNVVTLAAGSSAYASNTIVGATNYLTLGIPQGAQGDPGTGGGGSGGGISNIAVAGITGTLTGSGSNVLASVSLASLAGAGVLTNAAAFDPAGSAASLTNAITNALQSAASAAQQASIATNAITAHTNNLSNPHQVTTTQIGAVSTNDQRYLAALTSGVFSVGTSVSNLNGTLYIPTNGLGGGTAGAPGANGTNGAIVITNVITLAAGAQAYASNNIVGLTNNVTLGVPGSASTNYFALVFGAGLTNVATGSGTNVTNTVSITSSVLTNNAVSGTDLSGSVVVGGQITTIGAALTLAGSNAVRGVTMTNGTTQWADGVLNGSNGAYLTRGTTNYWITFP